MRNDIVPSPKKKVVITILIAIAAIILISQTFTIVQTGFTGVRVRLGQISQETLVPGVHPKIPFIDQIRTVNNKQQDVTLEGQIMSETSERATIFYEGITVTYQISSGSSSWLLANVTDYKNNLITNSVVSSAVKTASKKYPAVDATNRGIIEPAITQALQESVDEKYGPDRVTIIKVVVRNADFDESYNQTIANQQAAQIAYQTQQIQNKTNIELAEAEATVRLTKAQAEADALKIEAQAEADANAVLEASLTPNVLYYEYLQRWNGQLPMVSGSDSQLFVDIGELASSAGNNTLSSNTVTANASSADNTVENTGADTAEN